MPSGRTNNFPESGRGLGHVTPTIFGSTVGYPSDDSLAACLEHYTATWRAVCTVCPSRRQLDILVSLVIS